MQKLINELVAEAAQASVAQEDSERGAFIAAIREKAQLTGLEDLPVSTLKKMARDLTGKKLVDIKSDGGATRAPKAQVELKVHTTKAKDTGVYVSTAGTTLTTGQKVGGAFVHVGAVRQTIEDLQEALNMLEDRGFEV